MNRVSVALAVLVLASSVSAFADTERDAKLDACATITAEKKRLACFDQAVVPQSPAPDAAKLIASWSGSGMRTTRPFHAEGPWELQWDTHGEIFQVMLYHTDETPGTDAPQIIANQSASGTGSSYVAAGGDYYLLFNAMGSWSAKAVRVDN